MLQEKVANVAHGWLLKEEGGVGGTQLKHFWFVLFSNGILPAAHTEPTAQCVLSTPMPLTTCTVCYRHPDALLRSEPRQPRPGEKKRRQHAGSLTHLHSHTLPSPSLLGQSLGFIPVEECVESSHSSKQHTLHIKCSFDQVHKKSSSSTTLHT